MTKEPLHDTAVAVAEGVVVFFQDVWDSSHKEGCHPPNQYNDHHDDDHDGHDHDDDDRYDVSDIFFELANSPLVGYRLVGSLDCHCVTTRGGHDRTKNRNTKTHLTQIDDSNSVSPPMMMTNHMTIIEQDVSGAIQKHTGGIVWETSYLLLTYLLHNSGEIIVDAMKTNTSSTIGRSRTVLEVGAGCGMLGLSLYKANKLGLIMGDCMTNGGSTPFLDRLIITETGEVMANLQRNVVRNCNGGENDDDCDNDNVTSGDVHQHQEDGPTTVQKESSSSSWSQPIGLSICELDWTTYKEDCDKADIAAHSVDVLVGTDVVFSTRFVGPLLETMAYLAHPKTVAYLCLQERCKDSHDLLLNTATDYGFSIQDISDHVYDTIPSCSFGRDCECKILKLNVIEGHKSSSTTTTTSTTTTAAALMGKEDGGRKKRTKKKTKRKRDVGKDGFDDTT